MEYDRQQKQSYKFDMNNEHRGFAFTKTRMTMRGIGFVFLKGMQDFVLQSAKSEKRVSHPSGDVYLALDFSLETQ